MAPDTADLLQKVSVWVIAEVQLLQKDPVRRLGGGPTDAEEVKNHPFFRSVDWEKLYNKELPVPYVRLIPAGDA